MSEYKSAAADRASNAVMVVVLLGVLLFAGWLASTSTMGVVGAVLLFLVGLFFGGIVAALIIAGVGALFMKSDPALRPDQAQFAPTDSQGAQAKVPPNNPRMCPHCGRASVRRLSGFCDGCGSRLFGSGLWVAGETGDPVATYQWNQHDRTWSLLDTRALRQQERREAADAERERAKAEKIRLASRPTKPRPNKPRPSEPQPSKPRPRLIRKAGEAEQLCAEWVRWMGFPDAAVTPPGADGGIDVFGRGAGGIIAAQVKFEAVPAGRPKLQGLYGAGTAAGATVTAFFSSAGFSEQARAWADQVDMGLFEFTLDGSIEPTNEAGRRLFEA